VLTGRKLLFLTVVAALLFGCTSGNSGDTESGSGASTTTEPDATGPSPGVTDDTIKIGVTFVDTESLKKVGLNFNLGDYKAVYQALVDDINAKGGINGRKLALVFAPIDPTTTAAADASCVKLTEDEDVFLITGFFLNDAVVCPLDVHKTAIVGGGMTAERLKRAKAPWVTWAPDDDQQEAVVNAFNDRGELKGKVGVFGNARDKAQIDRVQSLLKGLKVDVVDPGIAAAPDGDVPANQAAIKTIGQRFKSEGVDTVVIAGLSGQDWPTYMGPDTSYRPKLLFLEAGGVRAFYSNDATTDTSVLDGSLAGGVYGPSQAQFEEKTMQECIATLKKAGIETPSPDASGDDPSNQPFQAVFQACPDMVLTKAVLDGAGKNLNYGTVASAIDGLKVRIPGDPAERTFGPPPAADGNPKAYIFQWDKAKQDLVLAEEQ
jgi:hypothetical protein